MSYYDPIIKMTNDKIQKTYQDYIKNYENNKYLNQFSNIGIDGYGYVDPINKKISNKNDMLIEGSIQQNPQNFFYRMQGGCHDCDDMNKRKMVCYSESDSSSDKEDVVDIIRYGGASKNPKGGKVLKKIKVGGKLASSDYRPEYKMKDDNIISKGLAYVGKNILYPIIKPLLYKKKGGKAMKDMTPTELQALEDARIANTIWAKSKAGKEYKANIADLTPKERLAYARNTAREYKKNVYDPKIARMEEEYQTKLERQKQEASRQQLGEEVEFQKAERIRLAEEAKRKKGSIWDDVAGVAIGELVNLIPAPKVVKDVLKTGAKEGYKALSSTLQGKGIKKLVGKKQLTNKQEAHQMKIRMIMNKERCSFKEALKKLKNYK